MNRSFTNVLFGAVGAASATAQAEGEAKTVISYTPEDAAFMLEQAQSVIGVPGCGMAVARAQHSVQELAALLIRRGTRVRFAIHPVAGRMPGHMNVLLAAANVPHELLCEPEQINDDFQSTDVALLVGASVAMMASELLANGIGRLTEILADLDHWLEDHEYESVSQMKGSMSQLGVAEPAAVEHANYM